MATRDVLPDRLHRVPAEGFVIRDEVQAFGVCLRDQDPVERILVEWRERGQRRDVARPDWEHACGSQLRRLSPPCREVGDREQPFLGLEDDLQ